MDLGSLRTLVTDLNFSAHAVDALVTRPAPDDTPIPTRAIWTTPVTEGVPGSGEFSRSEPLRRVALPLKDVPTVPLGTLVEAPERSGMALRVWRVDSFDHQSAPDYARVFVVPVPEST